MKFYNRQHEFYCGIDLHANSMHVCVVDHSGNFPTSYVYPKDMRGTRDLLRRRATIVKRRSATIVHVQMVNHQQNLPAIAKSISYETNRVGIAGRFKEDSVQSMVNESAGRNRCLQVGRDPPLTFNCLSPHFTSVSH